MQATNTTDFKDTAIGTIPSDWDIAKLSDVVTFTRKPRELKLSEYDAIPFIPMELVPDEGVHATQYLLKFPEDISSGTYVEEGDFLLAKITPSFENGKQGIVKDLPLNFAFATTEVFAVKPREDLLDKLFLFDFLKQSSVRVDIASRMEGTTGRQRVPKTVLSDHLLPLPPLPEQRRIAAVLNAIQEEIAVQDDIIAEAREFKRSLMQRLFTKGAGAEPAETKETEVGEIPAHWEIDELEHRADISTGTTPSTSNPDYYVGKTAFIKTAEIINNRISLSANFVSDEAIRNYNLKVYPPGTVLMAMYGQGKTRGQVALLEIPASTTQNAAAIVSDDTLHSIYLWEFLLSQYEQLRKSGIEGHISHLNLSYVKALKIPLPPPSEQESIAHALVDVDDKISIEEDRKTALQDFFKTMLHQLMTGQIRLLSDEGLPI